MDDSIAIIMAAGKGTRMKSERPKVLVETLGRPMIQFVLDAVFAAGISRVIVVVGYKANDVRAELATCENITFVEQTEQKGTGHAVMVCADELQGHSGPVLILTGDSPLVQTSSLNKLLGAYREDRASCIMGTAHKQDPTGLGRIVRDGQGKFLGVVEEKDATDQQRAITEVNMSTYIFNTPDLLETLPQLQNNNSQGEYYITDCPAIMKANGKSILAEAVLEPCESLSVNTLDDLQIVEDEMKRQGYAT